MKIVPKSERRQSPMSESSRITRSSAARQDVRPARSRTAYRPGPAGSPPCRAARVISLVVSQWLPEVPGEPGKDCISALASAFKRLTPSMSQLVP